MGGVKQETSFFLPHFAGVGAILRRKQVTRFLLPHFAGVGAILRGKQVVTIFLTISIQSIFLSKD